jgi:nitronate monooxygenase
MGAGVSDWRLARAVASTGQLGVVSGTGLDLILARRLQRGDPDGLIAGALARFPVPAAARRILETYYVPGGKRDDVSYRGKPMLAVTPTPLLEQLLVAGSFVEVLLARDGHDGPVGINLLEKIQLPTLGTLYGAMLAGVSYVLVGAGIPRAIPGILDRLSRGEPVELRLDVAGARPGEEFVTRFDPRAFFGGDPPRLARPRFLGIIASTTLASALLRKASGTVDGFVVEGPSAGGHNAPPRGSPPLGATGEPVYGPRDVVDLDEMKALGAPFWVAGSYGRVGGLAEALAAGAAGIQVGTAFAYCAESGLSPRIKRRVLAASRAGRAEVFTDPVASPTGFPIKVVQLAGTMSDADAYARRRRICDLGYLRHPYRKDDGTLGWRCPAEPVDDYVAKGGLLADTVGRKCVCNGLLSTIDLSQTRPNGDVELPFVTSGDRVATVASFHPPGATSYTAAHVLELLLRGVPADAGVGAPAGAARAHA